MAKLMRNLRKTHQRLSNSNFFNATKQNPSLFTSKLHLVSRITTRNCVSEMQYELEHYPPKQMLCLDSSSGIESLKCVSRVDLTLSGSFADMVLLPSLGGMESCGTLLFVLSNPGQLDVYDDACLSSLIDEKFSRDLSKEVSDAKVQASHTPSATLTGSTKWPLMGGVPCQSNDTEDALVERLYVAGYQDGSVRIWDATSDFFSAIYFSQCNTLAVHVLPQGDGPQCMAVFSFLNSPICNLQFADFGGRLAVGFECGRVAMLDISTLSVLFLTDGISDSSSPVRSLAVKSFSDTNSIANSTKDSNINTSTDSTKSVVFFMTKDGHIVVCDSTTGFILASQPIHSKESSIISMYILGNEAKNESAQTNAVEKDIPLAAELETSTETTYFGQRLKDLFVLLCCEDSLLLFSLKSVIQVNGYEFAFISLLAYENDLRIPESLPCLHNKVVAAAAEATINLSLSQKEVEDTAPGILSGIIKGFKAGKVEHKVDLPEISNSTCARLGHIFSYPPFLKPYTDIEEDPLFLKPHTVAVMDYQEVVELNIGSLALTLILLLCPLSPFFSNCTIDLVQMTLSFSILGADKRLEKERLFEGAPKTRTVGARIRKRKRK
ncbi:hypothetical protein Q3G72_014394 [Acer saccharum]|nr:hypothetical protein Q3G72_014394 [Acer saccharum]